jgi:hypothetical protein
MTTPNKQDSAIVTAVVAVGLVAVVGATLVGVLLALPDSANPATTITIVLGFFGTIVPTVLNALLGGRANRKLDRVLNGEMDAKIEAAVHRVLDQRETAA